jgi:PKD repeat protein
VTGDVSGGFDFVGGTYVGGLVGFNGGRISESHATGRVNGSWYVGGLVGRNRERISRSYATARVAGSDSWGGLVGFNEGAVSGSYAAGSVVGASSSAGGGGLSGTNSGTVSKSYWDVETSGRSVSGGTATGLSTAQMTGTAARTNMTGFSFGDAWRVRPDSYPRLVSQTGAPGGEDTAPTASFSYDPGSPTTGTAVTFDASGSVASDGTITDYEWDFDGDGISDATGLTSSRVYASPGRYEVVLTVTDTTGASATATRAVNVTSSGAGEVAVDVEDLRGRGTPTDPYLITNASELQSMEDDRSAYYALDSDIDATGTQAWNGGKGLDPVGTDFTAPFTGAFDGKGHSINHLSIARPSTNDVGLFGYVTDDAVVRNVSLKRVNVAGDRGVGGLVGDGRGVTVSNTSVSGTIVATSNAGGVLGTGLARSRVRSSYATGSVSADAVAGGLIGTLGSESVVRTSYSASTGDGDSSLGLVGSGSGTVTSSYWQTESTDRSPTQGGGTPLTAAQMTGPSVRAAMPGFAFGPVWQAQPDDYPVFAWQTSGREAANTAPVATFAYSPPTPRSGAVVTFDASNATDVDGSVVSYEWDVDGDGTIDRTGERVTHTYPGAGQYTVALTVTDDADATATATETLRVSAANDSRDDTAGAPPDIDASDLAGSGTSTDPYVVTNASELQALDDDLDAYYRLGADIDANETAGWNGGSGFVPIGSTGSGFVGTLDGRWHTITNLTVDRPQRGAVALFETVGDGGEVRRLGLRSVDTDGRNAVGGIAANNGGTIRRVSVSGSVDGLLYAGGVVAENDRSGTVTNVSASVRVQGAENVGGLVGGNFGTITDTYATGRVTGATAVGGLVGRNPGTVRESYIDRLETGQEPVFGGATGLATAEMTGPAARTNMPGFAFGDVWETRAEGYPVLTGQSDSEESGAPGDGTPLVARFGGGDDEIGNLDVLQAVNAANAGTDIGGEPVGNLDVLQLVNYVTGT